MIPSFPKGRRVCNLHSPPSPVKAWHHHNWYQQPTPGQKNWSLVCVMPAVSTTTCQLSQLPLSQQSPPDSWELVEGKVGTLLIGNLATSRHLGLCNVCRDFYLGFPAILSWKGTCLTSIYKYLSAYLKCFAPWNNFTRIGIFSPGFLQETAAICLPCQAMKSQSQLQWPCYRC